MREFSTPLDDRRSRPPATSPTTSSRNAREATPTPSCSAAAPATAWERRHRRRVPRRGQRRRQGPDRRRHRGRRPGRADLQDPLRVDAARLRDLVRRRASRCRSTRPPRPSRSAGSCATPAPGPSSPRAPPTSPGSPRCAATSTTLNHVWSLDDNARRRPDPARRRHHRRGAREAPYDGHAARPGHPDLHLRAPPAGPRAACSPTATSCSSSASPPRSSTSCSTDDDASTLLFLPLAHVFARIIQVGCVKTRVRLGHTADITNLVADLGEFRPTFVLAVPRVFEKVFNTASQRATADGRGKIFDRAAETAIAYSRGLDKGRPSLAVRAQHAVFSRLVYGKLRDALGGRCRYAVSGGAPLGERLGHFYRGIGLTVLEGYGLTETTAAVTVNLPDAHKIGTVGRPLPGHRRAGRRRRRAAVPRRPGLRRLLGQRGGHRARPSSATAGSTPATSARSTTRASSGSPAARRRSW